MHMILHHMIGQQADIFPDGAGRHAIVARQEFIHSLLYIQLRIPHQAADQVHPKLTEFTGGALGVALLENPGYAVLQEESDILLEHMEIGEGRQIEAVVGGVVP